jgi:hypothetical protein
MASPKFHHGTWLAKDSTTILVYSISSESKEILAGASSKCDDVHIEDRQKRVSRNALSVPSQHEETIMNPPASLGATATTNEPLQSTQADRPIVLWVLTGVLIAIAVTVLVLDASLSTEQRIALLIQSGIFP